jgi:hypothetical protein
LWKILLTVLRAAALLTVALIVSTRLLVELKAVIEALHDLLELVKRYGFISALQQWGTWGAGDWIYNGVLLGACLAMVTVATWHLHTKSIKADAEEFFEELEKRQPGLRKRLESIRPTWRERLKKVLKQLRALFRRKK